MDEKKLEKKGRRFACRLKSSKGINCTDSTSTNIVLCNVGQATDFQKEDVCDIISQSGIKIPTPKYIAEKGESYSFLVFDSIEHSKIFYSSCNGIKFGGNGVPVIMNFVDSVPNTEVVCSNDNPPGLYLLENFITPEEESLFTKIFDWAVDPDSDNLKNRQVKHYGYQFRYGSNDVDLNCPLIERIPDECDMLWERLKQAGINVCGYPDQLTVNKYLPGQGIPSHVDKHSPFGDTILSLSLGGDVVMDWKHHTGQYIPTKVAARSMLVMSGEARYDWQHGIQPRTWDAVLETRTILEDGTKKLVRVITADVEPRRTRISLTFRWTRSGPCDCRYRTLCDSVDKSTDNIANDVASNLEELHVHQVYEQIAAHFSSTRHKPWPKVVEFMRQVPAGSVVLDLGCGNGKNVLRRDDVLQLPAWPEVVQLMRQVLDLGCRNGKNVLRRDDVLQVTWPEVVQLMRQVLDLGCGNGKNVLRKDDELQIAGERSSGLVTECKRAVRGIPGVDCVNLDLLHAPLRDACADRVICIAVIHHFSSRARRIQAIATIHRLLRPGGKALITVWAKDQTNANYLLKSKQGEQTIDNESCVTVNGLNLPVHENRTQFKYNDLLVPWKLRKVNENKLDNKAETTLLRYYHVFQEDELDGLCREFVDFKVESSFYEEGNWCVVCYKLES